MNPLRATRAPDQRWRQQDRTGHRRGPQPGVELILASRRQGCWNRRRPGSEPDTSESAAPGADVSATASRWPSTPRPRPCLAPSICSSATAG